MEYLIEDYQAWVDNNIAFTNVFSEESMKQMAIQLLLGRNYRLITENNTKNKLALTYVWLVKVVENARNEFGDEWKEKLMEELSGLRHRTPEQDNLLFWLAGLTKKTSANLGVEKNGMSNVIVDLQEDIGRLLDGIGHGEALDTTWLLMMAGAATLYVRGSEKSKIGKRLEGILIRAMLHILGLRENVNFWMNIDRDAEVDRETDCEIQTTRGRIRVEVGLISSGNQEVVEDKIGRVGSNGVIIFDKVGNNTRIYETAERHRVKLIQIRNNQPLVELYRHLIPLVNFPLNEPPVLEETIVNAVNALPIAIFQVEER